MLGAGDQHKGACTEPEKAGNYWVSVKAAVVPLRGHGNGHLHIQTTDDTTASKGLCSTSCGNITARFHQIRCEVPPANQTAERKRLISQEFRQKQARGARVGLRLVSSSPEPAENQTEEIQEERLEEQSRWVTRDGSKHRSDRQASGDATVMASQPEI